MLDCWRENPVDRPTFERLRNTMKEMERNHKVRRVRTFFKREKQPWIPKVHLGKKLIIIQGWGWGECVALPSRPHISIRDWLNIKLVAAFIFHSAWFLLKQFIFKLLSITLHVLLTTTKPPSTWLAHLIEAYRVLKWLMRRCFHRLNYVIKYLDIYPSQACRITMKGKNVVLFFFCT